MSHSNNDTPCSACSWTPERERNCQYKSNLTLFHEASDRGAWSLGSKFIVKDRGIKPPSYEAVNTQFVKENTTIPIPNILHEWTENERTFTIAERIPGKSLDQIWSQIPQADRERIAKETAGYILQLRRLRSPRMGSVHGQPLYAGFLFVDDCEAGHGPLSTPDELWAEMTKKPSERGVPNGILDLFGKHLPSPYPWTFTHGDLTYSNIMVDPETYRLTGIVDWEGSGYYPVWWEFVHVNAGKGDEDAEWQAILRKYMPQHIDAWKLWKELYSTRFVPIVWPSMRAAQMRQKRKIEVIDLDP